MITTYFTRTELGVKQTDLHDPSELALQLADDLVDYSPSIGFSERGWLSIRLAIDAPSAETAARLVALLVRDAARRHGLYGIDGWEEILALEVYTEAEFDAREGFAERGEQMSVADAMSFLGVSRQAILQQIESGTLAGAVKKGDTYTIPADVVRKRARERVELVRWFKLGEDENEWFERDETRRDVLGPMYDALENVGALPAYREAVKAERGELHDAELAAAWNAAERLGLAAIAAHGESIEGEHFAAAPLGTRGTTGY